MAVGASKARKRSTAAAFHLSPLEPLSRGTKRPSPTCPRTRLSVARRLIELCSHASSVQVFRERPADRSQPYEQQEGKRPHDGVSETGPGEPLDEGSHRSHLLIRELRRRADLWHLLRGWLGRGEAGTTSERGPGARGGSDITSGRSRRGIRV